MNELSDIELMIMYQNGSEEAFQIIYKRHSSKIYNFLTKRVQKAELVAEIFQEVFIKVHRSKSLYNKEFPLLPWLFTITKSVMLDEFKKNKNFKFADNFDFDRIETASLITNEHLVGIDHLIKALPSDQNKAITMRYLENNTFDEIAAVLETSPVNVRQILSRGIKRLKVLISQGENS